MTRVLDDALRLMRYLLPFVGRAAVLWLLVRLALFAVGSVAGAGDPDAGGMAASLTNGALAMLPTAAVVTLLVFIDIAALRERAFMANLGVGRRPIVATAFATAVALEIAAAALAPVLA